MQLVGLIVSFDPPEYNRWIFHIDDGSGRVIEVVCSCALRTFSSGRPNTEGLAQSGELVRLRPEAWMGKSETGYDVDMRGLEVGKVVKVKGQVGEFRDERQILLERIGRSLLFHTVGWARHGYRSRICTSAERVLCLLC